MIFPWGALLLVFAAASVDAQPASDRLSEILMERESALTLLDQKEESCSERFAVTDCVNAVRKRRREILLPLQREENQLRLQERQNRQNEQVQAKLKQKERDGAIQQMPKNGSVQAQQAATRIAEKSKSHHEQAQARVSLRMPTSSNASAQQRTDVANREAFAKKAADLQKREHDRNQRMKKRSEPRAPLPVPP